MTSPDAADEARAQAEAAEADARAAGEALSLVVEGPRREDIAQARAELEALEAEVVLAGEHREDATLRAPADGTIRDRILEPGDMASPPVPAFTLAFTDPVWVRAYAPESALGRIAPGMQAVISTDSYPGKIYRGWIGFIAAPLQVSRRHTPSASPTRSTLRRLGINVSCCGG